jgi:hypothetical protein
MMKLFKAATFLLVAICFTANLQAQTFDVSWGDKAKLKYDFDDAVPIGGGKTIVLKLKSSGGGMFSGAIKYTPIFMLVNENTETLQERELVIEEKNSSIKGFEKYGQNVFFLYSAYDKETKNTSVYALKIDEKTLAPISKTTLGSYESDNKGDQAQVSYKLSQDSTKVLLFVEGPERKKENKKFYAGVFDTDLKKQWAKEIELPILEKFVSIYDYDVTDDSKVYVAIKHYEKEVSRESVRENGSKIPSYVYKLLVYSKDAKDKEIVFKTDDNFIQGTKLKYNKANNTVTVAGLYKKKANGHINGAFYATIDGNSSEVKNPKMVTFDEDLIRLVDKDGFGNKKASDPGLSSHFRIRHIMARPNGSIDLISEYYELIISTYFDKYGSRTDYRYYYGDIVNTNIDKDGKATFTRIPKNQKMINMNLFMGYYPFIFKDKLVLLFNDDKDNIDRDLEKKPDDIMKFKNSVLAAATIDNKGVLSRQAIFSNDDEDYVTIPTNFTRITDNSFLIQSDLIKMFKKRTRFGILKVK